MKWKPECAVYHFSIQDLYCLCVLRCIQNTQQLSNAAEDWIRNKYLLMSEKASIKSCVQAEAMQSPELINAPYTHKHASIKHAKEYTATKFEQQKATQTHITKNTNNNNNHGIDDKTKKQAKKKSKKQEARTKQSTATGTVRHNITFIAVYFLFLSLFFVFVSFCWIKIQQQVRESWTQSEWRAKK